MVNLERRVRNLLGAGAIVTTLLFGGCGGGPGVGPSPTPDPTGCQKTTVALQVAGINSPATPLNGTVYIDGSATNNSLVNSVATVCADPGVHKIELQGTDFYPRGLNIEVQARAIYSAINDIADRTTGLPSNQADYMPGFNLVARYNYGQKGQGAAFTVGTARLIAPTTWYVDLDTFSQNTFSEIMSYLNKINEYVSNQIPQTLGSTLQGSKVVRICTPGKVDSHITCDGTQMPTDFSDPYHPKHIITVGDPGDPRAGGRYDAYIVNGVSYKGLIVSNVIAGGRVIMRNNISNEGLLHEMLHPLGFTSHSDGPGNSIMDFPNIALFITPVDSVRGKVLYVVLPGSLTANDTSAFETLRPIGTSSTTSFVSGVSSPPELGFAQIGHVPGAVKPVYSGGGREAQLREKIIKQ